MKKSLAIFLTCGIAVQAHAASLLDQNAYQLNRKTYMIDLIESAGKAGNFTEEELSELEKIQLIPVSTNEKSYGVPTPITATDNWVENRYSVNLAVTEKLMLANLKLIDSGLSYMGTLVEKLTAGTALDDQDILANASKDLKSDIKQQFIDICKSAAGFTPFDPANITNFEEALVFVNDVMRILPSMNAQVKIAYGYPIKRAAIYSKAKAALPDIQFIRLTPEKATLLAQKDPVGKSLSAATDSNTKEAIARVEGLKRLQSFLAEDLAGLVVSSAGATASIDLYYQLVRGWGISADSNYSGAGSYMFPGRFEAQWPITVNVQGTVQCSYNAQIRDGYYFEVASTAEGGMADFTTKIPNAVDRNEVKCVFRDNNGKVLSNDGLILAGDLPSNLPDRNATATSLNTLIAGKIDEFKKKTQESYLATKSFKTEFLRAAVAAKDGWKVLPVPVTREQVAEWENLPPQCEKIPREVSPRDCKWVVSTKYPTGKQFCRDAVYEYDEVCKPVQRLVWKVIEKPLIVSYPKNGATIFDQLLNEEMVFNVNSTETQYGTVNIENDVCIRRVQLDNPTPNRKADFLNCGASDREAFNKRITDDVNGTPVPMPTPGVVIPD